MTSAEWLEGKARNVYSQFGEDGLVEAILARIGTTNRWCVEFGAADGKYLSNTLWLREQGWKSVLLEADGGLCTKGKRDYGHTVHNVAVTPDNVDEQILSHGCPERPDFCSIDIDGEDWHVWHAMTRVRPRVVCIEFRAGTTEKDITVMPYGQGSVPTQAGFGAIRRLAEEKGYVPVAQTVVNLLCVAKEDYCG